jgi:hypothetical protein
MNLFTKITIMYTSIKRRHSFFTNYIRSSKISSNISLTPLHPFHHALSIQFRCYPVVVQHMKRKRLQQHGVWTLHSKTILERFLSTTYFLQPISFYFTITLVQFDFVSTIFISLHYNHTEYSKRDIIINDLDIMPWLRTIQKMPPSSSFFDRQLIQNSFFLFARTFLYDEKIRWKKVLCSLYSANGWETPSRPLNIKCIVPSFFGHQFFEKNGVLQTQPVCQRNKRFGGFFELSRPEF